MISISIRLPGRLAKPIRMGWLSAGPAMRIWLRRYALHRMLGKIERHDGGVEPAVVDRGHRLVGALQIAHPAVVEPPGDRVVVGAAHPLAGELRQIAAQGIPLRATST